MNLLSFELEEWFQIVDHAVISRGNAWQQYDSHIYENTDKMLKLVNESCSKATVFIPGWIAQNYPAIVRRVAGSHSIGAQGMSHVPVSSMSESTFKTELETSIKTLQDICGKEVIAFRAPGFSLTTAEGWAFEAMADMGISLDSSLKVLPDNVEAKPFIIERGGIRIKEFPTSRISIKGRSLPFGSGFCFRNMPSIILKKLLRCNTDYNLVHVSTREFDPRQPILRGLGTKKLIEHYLSLGLTQAHLTRVLDKIDFIDLLQAESEIDWNSVPVVKL